MDEIRFRKFRDFRIGYKYLYLLACCYKRSFLDEHARPIYSRANRRNRALRCDSSSHMAFQCLIHEEEGFLLVWLHFYVSREKLTFHMSLFHTRLLWSLDHRKRFSHYNRLSNPTWIVLIAKGLNYTFTIYSITWFDVPYSKRVYKRRITPRARASY